ncbi:hypothetical protein DYE49_02660 [Treponema rectale]|uniref:ATPase dynein-related AAA domain-containing protein n=1 Tax=Treponema rectale TaxID=744512 RepID=A0A7M1XK90_9SPIR|nr:hypothetical protein DYE49_02660 [Treponema rectale]
MKKKEKQKAPKSNTRLRAKLFIKYSLLMFVVFMSGSVFALLFLAILYTFFPIGGGNILDQISDRLYYIIIILLVIVILYVLFKIFVYQMAYKDAIDEQKDEDIKITEIHQGPTHLIDLSHMEYKGKATPIINDKTKAKEMLKPGESRFPTLAMIDETHPNLERVKCDPGLTLESICYNFKMFAAGDLHLYYSDQDIRSFVASLACSKILLLQGMSGTGKTSLPVAFGKFISNPTAVVPVQPTWKERSDLLGYYNEFTGKFSETPLLTSLYKAGTTDSIQLVILDEVNIARVEYYFAEFLSLLELPDQNSRILQVASSGMDKDPKRMSNGALLLPENVWFVGTANNDDSTFAISDKVYDRASVLDLDKRAAPFRAESSYSKENISLQRLRRLNAEAQRRFELTNRDLRKINTMDKFLREAFQVSFGNRIMRQIKLFVPTYVACGGDSSEALDVILSKKVLRKLSSCNPVLVKARAGELRDLIISLFGEDGAPECLSAIKKISDNA